MSEVFDKKYNISGLNIDDAEVLAAGLEELAEKATAISIKPELTGEIFSIDTKTKTLGTAGEKGTGIGLILCKEFIERNSGKIRLESTPGKGSNFYFTLPKPA